MITIAAMVRRHSILSAFAATIRLVLGTSLLASPAAKARGQTNLALLTTARQIHQLTAEQAVLGYPVRVQGVSTFCDEPLGQLFVQDETGGIFVEIKGPYGFRMRPGQLLDIEGVSAPGGFAPDIDPRQVRLLGEAPLPAARSVSFEQMAAGQEDCNWVEFSGIVRSLGADPFTPVGLKLAGGGGMVMVPIKEPERESCLKLVDAEVTARGVCIAHFNRKGQLIQVAVQISTMNDIAVRKSAPSAPFGVPTREISKLLQYAPREAHGHRVKVQGVVTLQQVGRSLFIADATQGLYVQTSQTNRVKPGDRVEVLGFPGAGEYVAPVMQDAMFRKTGTGPPLPAVSIAAADARRDTNHAALVRIEGRLLNRVERRNDLLLELQSSNLVFQAELDAGLGQPSALGAIPNGSKVLVTGVCLVPEDQDWLAPRPQSISLLLRSPADVVLVERPSWWTARHTLWVLAVTLAVFCASLAWVAALRRQVRAQTRIIAEKIQREAALEERTRIARDLHDDLGASLTHISFLSEVAQKEKQSPAAVQQHLSEISGSSQEAFQALDEIVWVVNPKNDTLENLNNYICHFAAHFFRGTPTRCRFDLPATLPDHPIPTEVRNNLFFAVKEALNNVRKHAEATEVALRVRVDSHAPGDSRGTRLSPARQDKPPDDESAGRQPEGNSNPSSGPRAASTYSLAIEDNGCGFIQTASDSLRNGLSNMRDRLQNIGGHFSVESKPGVGTKIQLLVPL
jgi:signal transduction histidine kinase